MSSIIEGKECLGYLIELEEKYSKKLKESNQYEYTIVAEIIKDIEALQDKVMGE
jgi:hypothetical protein